MIYIFDKIHNQYFSSSNIDKYDYDYTLEETNININIPTEVQGETSLTGNININSALKALENINLYGEVKNTNNSVIFSKYGDIVIDSQNVNLNGLVYAPFGTVIINAINLNLNNVVIIAERIEITCPNVNANYSSNASTFVGTNSESIDIPYDEWQYMKDENKNEFPDFFENPDNWSILKDTDGEGLPDCVEYYIGTDESRVDSDNDLLNDYYEIFITHTNPILYDTDGNGISDGKEDFDLDNLRNYQEYAEGTSPWDKDSDGDNLTDYDEIYVYHTNPLKIDTDDDGMNDDDEIEMNFSPINSDSNDNGILDGNEITEQNVEINLESHDKIISNIAVKMKTNGNLRNNLTVNSVYGIDLLSSDVVGLVGDPFQFEVDTFFENADITFFIDPKELNNMSINDLCVLWYDEYSQKYYECTIDNDFVTIIDESNFTITVRTKHFSKYMLVNKKEWYKVWEDSFNTINNSITNDNVSTSNVAFNTVFVIDTSGSMTGYSGFDPIIRTIRDDAPARPPITSDDMEQYWLEHYGYNTCKRITACENFINSMKSADRAAIVTFSNKEYTKILCNITDSKFDLIQSLQKISDGGGTYYSTAINSAINILRRCENNPDYRIINRIILLSDGEVSTSDIENTNEAVSIAFQNKIKIYTFGLGNDSGDDLLKDIANKTKGDFNKVILAENLPEILKNSDVNSLKNDPDFTLLWKLDSDGDGIPDLIELYGLRPNGKPIGTDINNPDSDGDGLPDGDEIHIDKNLIEDSIYNGSIKNGITTPSDPTSYSRKSDYGRIKYQGEYYDIYVPALQRIRKEYYYEPVCEKYKTLTENDIDFNMFEYIHGREVAVTDDLHDGSQPVGGGYTFVNKKGYLKNTDTFRKDKPYNIAAGSVLIFSNIIDLINGSLSRKSICFEFYRNEPNDFRKVIITVSSSDVEEMYNLYAGRENSSYIENMGYPFVQVLFSNACASLYEEITGTTIDYSYTYDMIISVDQKHKGSDIYAQLWLNDEGLVMATPFLYEKDSVKIVRRSSVFKYDVMLELPCSDTINLDQSFIELFNRIYEKDSH
ncbi:MAG: VWA domain-containing protein [Oscillospiraceae bacterium]|nr:VWA domain-containing protein [Oscillospiraceae bacterium]